MFTPSVSIMREMWISTGVLPRLWAPPFIVGRSLIRKSMRVTIEGWSSDDVLCAKILARELSDAMNELEYTGGSSPSEHQAIAKT